jgi:hypothetical protein
MRVNKLSSACAVCVRQYVPTVTVAVMVVVVALTVV